MYIKSFKSLAIGGLQANTFHFVLTVHYQQYFVRIISMIDYNVYKMEILAFRFLRVKTELHVFTSL